MYDNVATEDYKGFTITIQYDQDAESPADWGNYIMHQERNDFVDPDTDELTTEAKRLIKQGILWPYDRYEHGNSVYRLTDDTENNSGWIEFTPGYVKAVSFENRRNYADGDLDTYTQWANGEVYGYVIERDGVDLESLWGIYDSDNAMEEAKAVCDDLAVNLAKYAKNANQLHN